MSNETKAIEAITEVMINRMTFFVDSLKNRIERQEDIFDSRNMSTEDYEYFMEYKFNSAGKGYTRTPEQQLQFKQSMIEQEKELKESLPLQFNDYDKEQHISDIESMDFFNFDLEEFLLEQNSIDLDVPFEIALKAHAMNGTNSACKRSLSALFEQYVDDVAPDKAEYFEELKESSERDYYYTIGCDYSDHKTTEVLEELGEWRETMIEQAKAIPVKDLEKYCSPELIQFNQEQVERDNLKSSKKNKNKGVKHTL